MSDHGGWTPPNWEDLNRILVPQPFQAPVGPWSEFLGDEFWRNGANVRALIRALETGNAKVIHRYARRFVPAYVEIDNRLTRSVGFDRARVVTQQALQTRYSRVLEQNRPRLLQIAYRALQQIAYGRPM